MHQQKISSTLLVNLFLLWIVWLFACFLFGVLWGEGGVVVLSFLVFFGMHHLSELIRFPVLYNDFL